MKVTLPKSWEKVTVGQFIEISQAKTKNLDEYELVIELLSILSGVDRPTLERVELATINKLYSVLSFMEDQNFPDKLQDIIEINGTVYKCDFNIKKITAGQYIDLKHLIKDPKHIIDNLHLILAVFYIPEGKKYNDKNIIEVADDFLNMPITVAYPAAVFFWNLYRAWIKIINHSLNQEMLKKVRKGLKTSTK